MFESGWRGKFISVKGFEIPLYLIPQNFHHIEEKMQRMTLEWRGLAQKWPRTRTLSRSEKWEFCISQKAYYLASFLSFDLPLNFRKFGLSSHYLGLPVAEELLQMIQSLKPDIFILLWWMGGKFSGRVLRIWLRETRSPSSKLRERQLQTIADIILPMVLLLFRGCSGVWLHRSKQNVGLSGKFAQNCQVGGGGAFSKHLHRSRRSGLFWIAANSRSSPSARGGVSSHRLLTA